MPVAQHRILFMARLSPIDSRERVQPSCPCAGYLLLNHGLQIA